MTPKCGLCVDSHFAPTHSVAHGGGSRGYMACGLSEKLEDVCYHPQRPDVPSSGTQHGAWRFGLIGEYAFIPEAGHCIP